MFIALIVVLCFTFAALPLSYLDGVQRTGNWSLAAYWRGDTSPAQTD